MSDPVRPVADFEAMKIQQDFYLTEEGARVSALRRERETENAACAALVRAAGCACARSTGEGPDGWIDGLDPVEYESYIAPLVVKVHNPQCPHALAAAIEARR